VSSTTDRALRRTHNPADNPLVVTGFDRFV